MEWDFACPDWVERLREGRSLLPELPLVEEDVQRAVAIFNKLRLPDVVGQPRLEQAAGEWQRDIVRPVFGSLIDGVRMVPEVFDMVPKKNSKTTCGAALSLTAMLMNERPRAEAIYVGPTQEVSDVAFQQTVGMIEADEYLAKRFHVAEHTKTITDRRNKARLKIKTFDMRVMTGSKPFWVLLDELHLMSSIKGASRIIGQIRGGMLANPEAVLVMITTQSDQPPAGAFKAELDYARGVRDGRIKDSRVLPLLYEFPAEMQQDEAQWRDQKNWPMVLPNLGYSITLDRLAADYRAAREKGEEEERRWASQHLNVQIGLALHADRWPGAMYWSACGADAHARRGQGSGRLTLEGLLERSEVVVLGIDGGGLDDLLGFGVIGRCSRTRRWLHWGHAWAHPSVLERRKSEAERFEDFERDGDLTLVSQIGDDVDQVAELARLVYESGLLDKVGVDPAGLGGILDALVDEDAGAGVPEDKVVGISQGWRLMGAIKTVERKLAAGDFEHGAAPLMAWCVGNAKVVPVGNAINITKAASGTGKIDPLMALFNAADLMARNPAPAMNVGAFFANPVIG